MSGPRTSLRPGLSLNPGEFDPLRFDTKWAMPFVESLGHQPDRDSDLDREQRHSHLPDDTIAQKHHQRDTCELEHDPDESKGGQHARNQGEAQERTVENKYPATY